MGARGRVGGRGRTRLRSRTRPRPVRPDDIHRSSRAPCDTPADARRCLWRSGGRGRGQRRAQAPKRKPRRPGPLGPSRRPAHGAPRCPANLQGPPVARGGGLGGRPARHHTLVEHRSAGGPPEDRPPRCRATGPAGRPRDHRHASGYPPADARRSLQRSGGRGRGHERAPAQAPVRTPRRFDASSVSAYGDGDRDAHRHRHRHGHRGGSVRPALGVTGTGTGTRTGAGTDAAAARSIQFWTLRGRGRARAPAPEPGRAPVAVSVAVAEPVCVPVGVPVGDPARPTPSETGAHGDTEPRGLWGGSCAHLLGVRCAHEPPRRPLRVTPAAPSPPPSDARWSFFRPFEVPCGAWATSRTRRGGRWSAPCSTSSRGSRRGGGRRRQLLGAAHRWR